MIVIADASPINYLVLIGHIDILPALYQRVLIPQEVYRELRDDGAPPAVRTWATDKPHWLAVATADVSINHPLRDLDAGEREAILLALQQGIRYLLMDDADGRAHARRLHLEVTGTLGILEKAADAGLLNFSEALTRLDQTNFRIAAALRDDFLRRND